MYFGGKSYQQPFVEFTGGYRGARIGFYNAEQKPDEPSVTWLKYETSAKTNWHYLCAADFIAGKIKLPS